VRNLLWICLLVASVASAQSQPANDAKPRIQLVSEFVRELEVVYQLQQTAIKELAEDNSSSGKLMTGIRVGTRTVLEMNDSINRSDGIAVVGQWAEFRDVLKQLDSERIKTTQEMTQGAKAIISGKPDVDIGALTARAPELTAKKEQIDKLMFTMSRGIFLALVDDNRVGPDGNLHHLLLTKKERANMIKLIDSIWGKKLDDKNADSIISAAWSIKYGLTRLNYKAADEP
jgi:hypothetical protein